MWKFRVICDRWRFAYDFVVGEHVRRRRDMWSWERIRVHRQFFHEYKRLWVINLSSYILSTADKLDIEVIHSDVTIIIIIILNIIIIMTGLTSKGGITTAIKLAMKLKIFACTISSCNKT